MSDELLDDVLLLAGLRDYRILAAEGSVELRNWAGELIDGFTWPHRPKPRSIFRLGFPDDSPR